MKTIKKQNKMNRLFQTIIVVGLAAVVASCGTKGKSEEQAVVENKVEKVKVEAIQKQTVARKLDVSATLEGYETMKVSPSLTGNIEHIYVEVGSYVGAGQMLVRMDQNKYNTAKLGFTQASIEFDRVKALKETNTVSQQTYDQAKLGYDQAKESLNFLTENTFVKSRFPGVVSAKNYVDGELYSGAPILVITQINQLKALVSIPESYFPLIKSGMTMNLNSDIYKGESFPATIETVYPTIDPSTHTFQAKLRIPNGTSKLRPGMFVRTTLEMGEVDALLVPYQAVLKLTGSNERFIFINNNGVAKRVSVTLGQRYDEKVEIISDQVKEGDQLIVVGQSKLVDGSKLEVIK